MSDYDAPSAISYTANGGVALLGAVTFDQWMLLAGVVLGVATFAVNWYYRSKAHALKVDEAARTAEQAAAAVEAAVKAVEEAAERAREEDDE